METKTISPRVQEILTENGLDFRIEKAPLFALNSLGQQVESPYFGLINSATNEVINTVKEGYTVSQNDEVIEMIVRGTEKFGGALHVTKAGSLNGGRKVYIQLAIEGVGHVGYDIIKRFITVIDSNDGSTSLSIGIGDNCMRCSNQFFKFYKEGEARFRHSASLEQKIKTIPYLIETALSESLKQIEIYNQFQNTSITRGLGDKMVKHLLGYDRVISSMDVMSTKSTRSLNIMDSLYADIDTEFNQVGVNLWGLMGGITRYTTHTMSKPKRENGHIETLLVGSGYNMNQKALSFCLENI